MPRYKVPELSTYEWQKAVQSVLSSPPSSPTKGDRYIIGSNPTGDWVDKSGQIAEYDDNWEYMIPFESCVVYVIDYHRLISYGTDEWNGVIANGKEVFEIANTGKVLNNIDFGKTFTCKNTVSQTFILPTIQESYISNWYRFIKLGTGTLKIIASGEDTIVDSSPGGYVENSKSNQTWATISLIAIDIKSWTIIDGLGTWVTN